MHRVRRWAVIGVVASTWACGSGGGTSSFAPSGPVDDTPPPAPDRARVIASIPGDGVSTVTGTDGAVEGDATVIVTNAATEDVRRTTAFARGSFEVRIPAEIGDPLRVTARDAAGNESPALALTAGPDPATIRLAVEAGDGQVGVRGRCLVDPLAVRVTAAGSPLAGLPVRFTAEADGELDATEVPSGPDGVASVGLTLPDAVGEARVRAAVLDGDADHRAVLQAEAVGPPEIHDLDPAAVEPGAPLAIEGANFSPIADHDVVTVGGATAAVTEASRTRLRVVVPDLAGPEAEVVVELTGVESEPAVVRIEVPESSAPAVGSVETAALGTGSGMIELPFDDGDEEYLVAVQSTAETPGQTRLALAADRPLFEVVPAAGLAAAASRGRDREAEIRARGYARLAAAGPARPPARALAPAQERSIDVWNPIEQRVESRTAALTFEGDHTLLYVDVAVAGDGLADADARRVGETFDREIYDRIREVFGEESDIDGNGKVLIFLTPIVNMESQLGGFVTGFFDPTDLSDDPEGNRAEIFYAYVPDPDGEFGTPTGPVGEVIDQILATTAHEFVHMVVANERVLRRGLPEQVLWLEEGMAHFGEFVVDRPDFPTVIGYLAGASNEIGLTADHDGARGPATLFVLRLAERFGDEIGALLTVAPGTGAATVESATGRGFGALVHDWALAVFNELFPVPELGPTFASEDFRAAFVQRVGDPETWPALGVRRGRGSTTSLSLDLAHGAVAYAIVPGGGESGAVDVRIDGGAGADLQVARVRIE